MTDVCTMVREIANGKHGERTKTLIDRASRKTGLGFYRVRAIWFGYARRVERHEYEIIKSTWLEEKVAQNVQAQLDAVISSLETLLRATDTDFHRPTLDALRAIRGNMV